MTSINSKLNAIYGWQPTAPAPMPVKAKPKTKWVANPKAVFTTHAQIADALAAGTITKRQASAFKAWITMRAARAGSRPEQTPVIRDRSKEPSEEIQEIIDRVSEERPTHTRVRGTIIDYKEAWGGTLFKSVVQRLWYVQPEGTTAKKHVVHLNQTSWGLAHYRDTLPGVGERVDLTVHGQIASKLRSESWKVTGDPVDDLLNGHESDFIRADLIEREGSAKRLVFTLAPDEPLGEAKNPKGETITRYRAHGVSRPNGYLYSSEFMQRFGTALIARHSQRLIEAGFDHVEIGKARFDMLGRLHCSYGTAIPGEFYWHGEQVKFEAPVDPDTGLFDEDRSVLDLIDAAQGGR